MSNKQKNMAKMGSLSLKKGGLVWSIWNFVEAVLFLVMGILTIAYSSRPDFHQTVFIAFSIFLIVGGALRILVNFLPVFAAMKATRETKAVVRAHMAYDMVISGSLELALGIALCVSMTGIDAINIGSYLMDIIVYFVSVLLIVAGSALTIFSIGFILTKLYKLYLSILEIIFGVGLVAFGIVIIIFFNNNVAIVRNVLLVIVGIMLILAAIAEVLSTISAINKAKKRHEEKSKIKEEEETKEEPKEESEEEAFGEEETAIITTATVVEQIENKTPEKTEGAEDPEKTEEK